jgi:molybdopterin biosynthesis enzyme MoaB
LIITTGGVGAEAKDRTIEALKKIDPDAATPYIMKFHRGTGRHEKDGVKIGVGSVGLSLIVSLPGPNDEVRLCMETLIEGLSKGLDKYELAEEIVRTLKNKYISEHGGMNHVG